MKWVIAYIIGLAISYCIMQRLYRVGQENGKIFDGLGLAMMLLLWPITMPILVLASLPEILDYFSGKV